MNREIKFRGKRIDTGEWVYGDLFVSHKEHHSPNISIATDEYHPVGYGSKTFYEVIPETVGQFTGLKDKNGRDIYEGDILKTETDKPMVVGWSERFASFVLNRDGWAFSHWFGEACNPENCEIIGNMFDNPEIIGEGKG